MGTGYTRKDTPDNISDGNIINASDLDLEFDGLQAAFDNTTGHTHDGTDGEGAPIEKMGPAQDIVVTATALRPKSDNTVDLGTSLLEFKDLYIDGTAYLDSVDIDGGSITGLTELTVDNLSLNGNTITTTDTNGNLNLSANGSGVIKSTNDLNLTSDSAKITFGADSEVELYHNPDSGLTLSHTGTGDDVVTALSIKSNQGTLTSGETLGRFDFTSNTLAGGVGSGLQARINIDATDTYSATVAGSQISFLTSKPDGTLSRSLYIDEEQNIRLDDNRKAVFGTGSDLQIYHDGTNSFIEDTGTGDLILRASDQIKLQDASGQNMAVFNENGGVDVTGKLTATNGTAGEPALYVDGEANTGWGLEINSHNAASASDLVLNGNAVLGTGTSLTQTMPTGGYYRWMTGATSNTSGTVGATEVVRIDTSGLDVTGTVTANGLTVDGNATISGGSPTLVLEDTDGAAQDDARLQVGASVFNIKRDADNLNRLTVGLSTGDISFYEDTGTTPKFFWDASAESLGIGTTSPSTTLDVVGTITGTADATLNGLTVGRGAGNRGTNIAVGYQALQSNITGDNNTAAGYRALYLNTIGNNNTAVGREALRDNTGNENTALGHQALLSNAGGNNNTAQGYQALRFNTSGSANTAVGRHALYSNTSASFNTAVGRDALQFNTTGANNTAQGYQALYSNTEGYNNTAVGRGALLSNTTGANNTAQGFEALGFNITGDNNTAQGYQALYSNTSGTSNTAVGREALQSNTIGSFNTAQGYQALKANTEGISNTAQGYMALTSNITGKENTAVGRDALRFNTTGSFNTAQGHLALTSNTGGSSNVAVGRETLRFNTTGNSNTAVGRQALYQNVGGISNTAQGYQALQSNVGGNENTAVGREALRFNTSGNFNTAQGDEALKANTTGNSCVAVGREALRFNTIGTQNTAVGRQALYQNTSGNGNTAQGYLSLQFNTTGNNNVAQGFRALQSNIGGSNNNALGYQALSNNTSGSGNLGMAFRNNAGTYSPVFNPTTQNNRIVMGHTSVTNAYVQVAWTIVSDARDKAAFAPVPHGLDFVNSLKPTEYQFKENGRDGEADGIKRYGFLAQDVLELEGDNPVIVDTEDLDKLKLKESSLIPVLVKAIQELTAEVQTLKAKLEAK